MVYLEDDDLPWGQEKVGTPESLACRLRAKGGVLWAASRPTPSHHHSHSSLK